MRVLQHHNRAWKHTQSSFKMKTAPVLVLCLAALLAAATGRSTSCQPGTSSNDGCNTCTCTSSGVNVCTLKFCGPSAGTGVNPIRVARAAKECEPGTTFKRDCKECFCTNDGLAACTRNACV